MSIHRAQVNWRRDGADFLDRRYSRRHRWRFDGGVEVPASSSPDFVPVPMSVAAAVDPEEAFVASLASCHMLWFLAIAAKRRFVIDEYTDDAAGEMGRTPEGKVAVTRVVLRPRVRFAGAHLPGVDEIGEMHRLAHEECNIANSVRSEVVCEPVTET